MNENTDDIMVNNKTNSNKILMTILTAIMLALSAGVVAADGTDPLTPPMVGQTGTETD